MRCSDLNIGNNSNFTKTHSSSITLTSDDKRLVVVNRETNSVSIIAVRDESHKDVDKIIAELKVGTEPRFVAISPDDQIA